MKPSITAVVNKTIVIVCCIHCDFMLRVHKNFLCISLVHRCKKVENHCSKVIKIFG